MKGVYGRRGFFGQDDERSIAAPFIAVYTAEQERQPVFAAEKYSLFIRRPFVKPVCGYQAAPLEKVLPERRLLRNRFRACIDEQSLFVEAFISPARGQRRGIMRQHGNGRGRVNVAGGEPPRVSCFQTAQQVLYVFVFKIYKESSAHNKRVCRRG